MKSGLTTAPLECFHGHTNVFHKPTKVGGSGGSMGSTSAQAQQFPGSGK